MNNNINIEHEDDNHYDKFLEEVSPRTNYSEKDMEAAFMLGLESASLLKIRSRNIIIKDFLTYLRGEL